ncbi:hypothetical protein AEQU2_01718 [Aequorivita lipolytica]|nr:hypothetical protein AEQU2_01718 [Aequorivita lipolytica]
MEGFIEYFEKMQKECPDKTIKRANHFSKIISVFAAKKFLGIIH